MKIVYDMDQNIYCVKVEYPETITLIHTEDIVEAREEFIRRMTSMFNYAICKQSKGAVNLNSEYKIAKYCKLFYINLP